MTDEIELKLDLAPAAVAALKTAGLLPGSPPAVRQRSIYFDTPDHDLAAAGLSLRIRQTAEKRIQTVKEATSKAAGLFARPEWEKPVAADRPDLDDTPLPARLGAKARALAPAFTVSVRRRTWLIDEAGARIELVIDQGAILAAGRRIPVSECELELEAGPPAALFSLARRLNDAAPLALGVTTKAERGYRLLAAAAAAYKAEPVALDEGMTAGQAFQAVALSCIRQFRLNEDLVLATRGPEPLHQARVALRRLRSAFSIHRALLDEDAAALRDGLKWLAATLGEARDLDVLLDRAPDGPLLAQIRAAREAAHDRAAAALGSPRARTLMLDLAAWLHHGDWLTDPRTRAARDAPARLFASSALARYRRKVVRAGSGLATMEDEARHALRKDAKKLRYAADFFAPLFAEEAVSKRRRRFAAALEDLQDQLGDLNDLSAAPALLDRIGIDAAPARAALVPQHARKPLLKAASRAYRNLAAAKRFWDKPA